MRKLAAVLVVFVLGGCTSVKMVQRDGCWVRRTEKRLLGTVAEEVGPCARPTTAFVENDPLTRLVQECVSRADYRWQMRALAAWDRREPWPEQLSESSVLQQCLDDSARGVLTETAALKDRNAALEKRLLELAQERQAERARMEEERRELVRRTDEERRELVRRTDEERRELFRRSEQERKDMLAVQSKLGDHLGDAAKKIQPLPAPNPAIATATATSEGRSRTEAAEARPTTLAIVPQPGSPVTATATMVPPAAPASVACPVPAEPARTAKAAKPAKASKQVARQARSAPRAAARLPACDPKATATTVAPASAPAAAPMSPPAAEAAGEKAATAAK